MSYTIDHVNAVNRRLDQQDRRIETHEEVLVTVKTSPEYKNLLNRLK